VVVKLLRDCEALAVAGIKINFSLECLFCCLQSLHSLVLLPTLVRASPSLGGSPACVLSLLLVTYWSQSAENYPSPFPLPLQDGPGPGTPEKSELVTRCWWLIPVILANSGGRDQEDQGLTSAQANSSVRSYHDKTLHTKGLMEWLKM
jgi:hypothetical protein